jgi:hypothetical protein
MDIKILIALITLTGIFATALFGLIAYFYKVRQEEKKSAKMVLYLLLELRHSLIKATFDPNEATQFYIKHCVDKLRNKGAKDISEKDFPDEIKATLVLFFTQVLGSLKTDVKERLLEPYEQALTELAKINPVLAYRLNGHDKLELLIPHTESHIENVQSVISPALKEEWAKSVMKNTSKSVSTDIIQRLCDNLEADVLLVAKSCSRKDYQKCKQIISEGINNSNKYEFDELDEMLEPVFDKLIEEAQKQANKAK